MTVSHVHFKTNIHIFLAVWLQIMLPCLGLRSISGYCVEYLEMILRYVLLWKFIEKTYLPQSDFDNLEIL